MRLVVFSSEPYSFFVFRSLSHFGEGGLIPDNMLWLDMPQPLETTLKGVFFVDQNLSGWCVWNDIFSIFLCLFACLNWSSNKVVLSLAHFISMLRFLGGKGVHLWIYLAPSLMCMALSSSHSLTLYRILSPFDCKRSVIDTAMKSHLTHETNWNLFVSSHDCSFLLSTILFSCFLLC